ncbi:glycosyltransferase family 4 protein [Neptuniibacter marinus]|uniref:glycosyltransferase family 4 protein n=1 Tax=Neptuniibacter marinus TaxID=1806670 RepID=UPI000946D883|nr:glycosyltransferase family 4 protein [Neptuniibacter marinus]
MNIQTSSIHIVRRYGPVGGMERYVWELTHALAKQGQSVKIICERAYEQCDNNIDVIELGEVKPKPRWLAMIKFSNRVSKYLNSIDTDKWVIHSHERCAEHHVTTFHGPSILMRKKRALDFISPRIATWEYLEKRELFGKNVYTVLPNSLLVSDQLAKLYPAAAHKLGFPAYPGVSEQFTQLSRKSNGHTIGFIGKEWQRKGLEFAVKVVKSLIDQNPQITFIVTGPEPEEIEHLFTDWPKDNYQLKGWQRSEDTLPYIDLLIHPAEVEPFGMVVAEVNAAGLPVVISDCCGIAELIQEQHGLVLPLNQTEAWQQALLKLMTEQKVDSLKLTWDNLSFQHQQLYLKIAQGK